MNPPIPTINQTDILARAFDRRAEQISPDTAAFFLSLELLDDDVERMNELAQRARAGTLSDAERHDLEEYRRRGRVMEMMKLKARMAFRRAE